MECTNCKSIFRDNNPPKLLISCGHTICYTCIQKLYVLQRIICPECQQENQIADISQIPTNQALLNLNITCSNSKDSIHNSESSSIFPIFKRFSSVNESPIISKRIIQKCMIHQKTIEAFCIHDCEGLCIDCILSENYKNKEILSIDKVIYILNFTKI